MSPWLQALLVGVAGVIFYLVMVKRLRKRHWPKAPKVVLPKNNPEGAAEDGQTETDTSEGKSDSQNESDADKDK
ncbi:MAG: hypothetical protein AAGB10_19900 [Pseudomonadota bacterium]